MFELGALRMLRGPTLNPGWFGHPATTTIYVLALVDISAFGAALLLGRATSIKAFGALVYADPSWMILPGRVAMALFGIATIALTSQLTRRYFGPGAGLAAAVLLAFNPVHITYSQIIRSDMMACFFMLLCMKEATTIAERGNRRAYGYTALWLGLAIATKWPFVLSGLAIVGATIVAIRGGTLDRRQGLVRLMGAGIAASTVLLLASPFLLLDYATVLRNLQGESQVHHLGATSEGFWWNLRWYAAGPILQGFGWIGIGLIMVGAWRLPRHRAALAVIAPLTAGFLLLLSIQHLVWERWALPLMPLGAIVAGLGLATVVRLPRDQGWERIVPWVAAMALILVLVPLAAQVRADDRTRANDTRQLASAWVRTNVAPGSTVLVEHFAFDLLDEPWRFLFPLGDMGCVDARAFLRGKVAYATIERARAGRSNIDLGTVSPAKLATCHADVAILTQYSRYQRERDRFPAEYAAYQTLIRSGQVAAVFSPQRGQVGG
ncbi:MAG: phospholipid carrier-dependent glycosyltransferase, partial [Oxalobacteraceae bacterium]